MVFDNLLNRANLNNIEFFLRTGAECCDAPPESSHTERLYAAERKTQNLLNAHLPNKQDFEKINEIILDLIVVHQDIYFEIGMLLGVKITMQINQKLEELTYLRSKRAATQGGPYYPVTTKTLLFEAVRFLLRPTFTS